MVPWEPYDMTDKEYAGKCDVAILDQTKITLEATYGDDANVGYLIEDILPGVLERGILQEEGIKPKHLEKYDNDRYCGFRAVLIMAALVTMNFDTDDPEQVVEFLSALRGPKGDYTWSAANYVFGFILGVHEEEPVSKKESVHMYFFGFKSLTISV